MTLAIAELHKDGSGMTVTDEGKEPYIVNAAGVK